MGCSFTVALGAQEFQAGVEEARQFQEDGSLPVGFELALLETDAPPPPSKPRAKKGKVRGPCGVLAPVTVLCSSTISLVLLTTGS
jgi:hypothetical protein